MLKVLMLLNVLLPMMKGFVRRALAGLMVVACLVLLYGCGPIQIPPPPQPPPPTTPPPPPPAPECLPGVPWCHEILAKCSTPDAPCKHNPSADPNHCELAPACPTTPPPPPPPPPGPPQNGAQPLLDDTKLELATKTPTQRWAAVNAAVLAYRQAEPGDWIEGGKPRLAGGPAAIDHAFGRVSAYLRPIRAAQSIRPDGRLMDAIFVSQSDGPLATGTLLEETHLFNYRNGEVATGPGAVKNIYRWTGGPEQPQGPPPPPSTPPPAGACGAPVPPPLSKIAAKIHTTGPKYTVLDSTPLVGPDAAYCRAIGYTDGRQHCSTRPEGPEHVAARRCWEDERTGGIEWRGTGGEPLPDGNPYGWRIPKGTTGTWQACSRRAPVVCSKPVAVP